MEKKESKILEVKQYEPDKKLHKPDEDGAIYEMHCVFFDEVENEPHIFTLEQLKMLASKLKLIFQEPSDLGGKNINPDLFVHSQMDVFSSSKTSIIFIDPVKPSTTADYETIVINNQNDFKDRAIKTKLLKEGIETLEAHYGTILFKERIPISSYNDEAVAALYAHLMQLKGICLVPVP